MTDNLIRDRSKMGTVLGAAYDLAVSYHAYMLAVTMPPDARCRSDHNSIVVWGRILMKMQEAFGIELHPQASIRSSIELAKSDMADIDAIMGGAVHEDGISPV